jgi:cellobiose transport system substrate-binding protein
MKVRRSATRAVATLLAAGLLAAATACGGASDGPADADRSAITLVVEDFGNFGYKQLLREYERAHPNIKVVERVGEYNKHHEDLAKHLDAGTGAGDVVAIEEGYVVQFRNRSKDFVNLLDHGAAKLADQWLPWKWQDTLSADGRVQIGLGTDIGGLGMCYRSDLFKQAGLPTDRDEVAKLWPTWEAYLATGRRFQAADLPAQWTDAASNLYNQVLAQQDIGYFDRSENLVAATKPGVKRAWDVSVAMVQAGQSAKYRTFNTQWVAALQGGRFATLACPAWMLGWIQQNAPATRGMWDVTAVPGGSGNWGGSWLAIPRQSAHPAEAYALAAWLTAPEQQLRIFIETGNLPSQPELYTNPAVTGFSNAFFRDAPVGKIFTESVERKPPQYLGAHNGAVRKIFEERLGEVEVGTKSASTAWTEALAQAARATKE